VLTSEAALLHLSQAVVGKPGLAAKLDRGHTKRVLSDWAYQMTILLTRDLWFSGYGVADNLGCSLSSMKRIEFAFTAVVYSNVGWNSKHQIKTPNCKGSLPAMGKLQ